MNFQTYAQNFARFHGASSFEIDDEYFIRINLFTQFVMRDALLKILDLSQIISNANSKALVRGLQTYLNIKSPVTVFNENNDTWALLLGERVLIYPQDNGNLIFTASPYYVSDILAFHEQMIHIHKAIPSSDLVYKLNGAIIYLDEEDFLFLGGNYFNQVHDDEWYRICFLTQEHEAIPEKVLSDKYIVKKYPFKTRPVETKISNLLQLVPQNGSLPPNYQKTNMITLKRTKSHPSYILQDIIDTYLQINKLLIPMAIGIVIESPIRLGFAGLEYSFTSNSRQFYAFSVNSLIPQKLLYVTAPYDRYFEYDTNYLKWNNFKWISIQYDYLNEIPLSMVRVWFDGHIIGFKYRETFFCLSNIILGNNTNIEFKNVEAMFEKLSFDIANSSEFILRNSYDIGNNCILHLVKHKNLPYDLYCLGNQLTREEFLSTNRPDLTPLVNNWLTLITSNVPSQNNSFPSMKYVRIMSVLIKHNICFRMKEKDIQKIVFEDENDIVFHVPKLICDFINELRFLKQVDEKPTFEESESKERNCIIL